METPRTLAARHIRELDLEEILRNVAYTSETPGFNFEVQKSFPEGTLHIRTTRGAGTNGTQAAWVPANDPLPDDPYPWTRGLRTGSTMQGRPHQGSAGLPNCEVYHTTQYGRQLHRFNEGAWVRCLLTWAEEVQEARAINTLIQEVSRKGRDDNAFRPLS